MAVSETHALVKANFYPPPLPPQKHPASEIMNHIKRKGKATRKQERNKNWESTSYISPNIRKMLKLASYWKHKGRRHCLHQALSCWELGRCFPVLIAQYNPVRVWRISQAGWTLGRGVHNCCPCHACFSQKPAQVHFKCHTGSQHCDQGFWDRAPGARSEKEKLWCIPNWRKYVEEWIPPA